MKTAKTDPETFFQMRVNRKFVDDLDDLRKSEDDLPSRADMIRRLVQRARAKPMKKAS